MHTTNLRKVGGSVMLAVPPVFLDQLHLQAGTMVGLTIDNDRLVIEPAPRLRYTLDELLTQAEASGAYPLPPSEREWIDAPAVGRELI
jgi:antitoxin ChpS